MACYSGGKEERSKASPRTAEEIMLLSTILNAPMSLHWNCWKEQGKERKAEVIKEKNKKLSGEGSERVMLGEKRGGEEREFEGVLYTHTVKFPLSAIRLPNINFYCLPEGARI